MANLVVGGLTVPVAPGSARRERLDGVDRSRAFDQTYRASVSGNPKRVWHFSTPPIPSGRAGIYETVLTALAAQTCSGDLLGGAENLVLQSEDFGVTWGVLSTPTRTPAAHTASGVTLDLLGDDDAAASEGYSQTVPFGASDGIKAVSVHAKAGTATAFTIQLFDATTATNRVRMTFGWSGGLPTLSSAVNGTYLGYESLADGVFRLLVQSDSVVAANPNSMRVRPASTNLAVADTGTTYLGGAQVEHSATPGPYVKTTTVAISTNTASCFAELTGRTSVKTGNGTAVVFDFTLEEA